MKLYYIWIFTTLFFFSVSAASHEGFKPAKLLERGLPIIPFQSIKADNGLVELTFMVNKLGKPSNIAIIRSSLPYFESKAVRALSTFRYEPALLNSKPVDSRAHIRLEFGHLHANVRPQHSRSRINWTSYIKLHRTIMKELSKQKPDRDKVIRFLKKIRNLPYKNFYSVTRTEIAQLKYSMKFESREQQLEQLHLLMMHANVNERGRPVLKAHNKLNFQLAMLRLMLALEHHAEVINKYNEFSNVPEVANAFSSEIKRLKMHHNNTAVFERKATISERGNRFLPLLKRSFQIDLLAGEVDTLELRCDAKYAKFEFKAGTQHKLPTAWGRCELQLNGQSGSTVSVLQR